MPEHSPSPGTYPLVPLGIEAPGSEIPPRGMAPSDAPAPSADSTRPSRLGTGLAGAVTLGLCLLHGLAIWLALGGWAGLTSPWPLSRDDHPYYYHSALVTRTFLRTTGTTAGYDPSFMAGYPKSALSISSSTLPELVFFLSGTDHPAATYKAYVFACAALVPWLVAGAGLVAGARADAIAAAVALWLVYLWTDFPINYAAFGMLPYLLAVPLGLLASAMIGAFVERGGLGRWCAAAVGSILVVLVHLTAAMIVVPAAALAYGVGVVAGRRMGRPMPIGRHLGVWLIPPLVLAANAFWWLPGIWLAATKGRSDFAFVHPEPVLGRLGQILTAEAPIQSVLIAAGAVGLAALARRKRVEAAALGGFAAAGFFWGYLAGGTRALDFLQPGRHTYAFYTGAALLGGIGFAEVRSRLRRGGGRLDVWFTLGLILVGIRLFGPSVSYAVRTRLSGPEPFLSSRPTARLLWLVDRLKEHLQPGERLLYEEGGFDVPGVPDPFRGGRYSGLLPHLIEGVELLGGPYLHVHAVTNFTQFGEGKLFGQADWGREHFERYARLYRPSAIVCWSPRARAFCQSHPELVRILEDDGTLLIGRVLGFGGAAIEGTAEVEAAPGRLRVSGAEAGPGGRVVLRYHHVPHLRSEPPIALEPVILEGDPVPFIGLPPAAGPLTLEMDLPP